MTRAYIGIDPGANGAVALFTPDGCEVCDYGPDAAQTVRRWTVDYTITLAALEKVNAMPGQGVKSMFNFGANFGWWRGVLDTLGIPYVEVRPQVWIKDCNVPQKKDKADKPGLAVARKMFPHMSDYLGRKKDDGRADSLLLAYWASRQGV